MSDTPPTPAPVMLLSEATLDDIMAELKLRGFTALLTGLKEIDAENENRFVTWVGSSSTCLGLVEYSKHLLLSLLSESESTDLGDV